MPAKPFLIFFFTSFGLMVAGSIIGHILESQGMLTKENLGTKGESVIMSVYFVLFCIMGFSIVPLMVRLFVKLQIRIGNGEFFLVKWISENERMFVYGVWGIFVTGLLIVLILEKGDILKAMK